MRLNRLTSCVMVTTTNVVLYGVLNFNMFFLKCIARDAERTSFRRRRVTWFASRLPYPKLSQCYRVIIIIYEYTLWLLVSTWRCLVLCIMQGEYEARIPILF